MLPGYEYILAFLFFLCTAAAGVTTCQQNLMGSKAQIHFSR